MSASQSIERLPSLPPPGLNEPFREDSAGTKRSRPISEQKHSVGLASLMMKPAERTEHMEAEGWQLVFVWFSALGEREVVMRDLCEGFQVCILGEPAPQVPRSMRLKEPMKIRRRPGREETMKVYNVYCNLLQSEGLDAGGGLLPELPPDKDSKKSNLHETRAFHHPSVKKANEQARRRQRRHGQLTEEIARISWPTLLQWVQHLEDLAADFRYRSVTAALNRALHQWRRKQATPRQQQEGVDLSMIIQWTWPDVTEEKIADMMLWIFEIELDKFKQPTPRLMDSHDRRILEALFHRLDENNVGSCSAEDIAGSKEDEDEGNNEKQNLVDVDTVKAVVGQERVELLPFLELMCESGVRAHEAATEVLLDDGRKLVLQYRRAVDSKVWVFDGTPADEEQCRRVARVFEAEVIRWRALAQATQRAEAQAAQEALLAQAKKEKEKEKEKGKEVQEEEEELELQLLSSDSDSDPEEQAEQALECAIPFPLGGCESAHRHLCRARGRVFAAISSAAGSSGGCGAVGVAAQWRRELRGAPDGCAAELSKALTESSACQLDCCLANASGSAMKPKVEEEDDEDPKENNVQQVQVPGIPLVIPGAEPAIGEMRMQSAVTGSCQRFAERAESCLYLPVSGSFKASWLETAVALDTEETIIGEVDVSDEEMQAKLLATELEVHGLTSWTFPDEEALARWQGPWKRKAVPSEACPQPEDTHLSHAFASLFGDLLPGARSSQRLLQIGNLRDSNAEDPARVLVAKHGMRGMVLAGARPSEAAESWSEGPSEAAIEVSIEGGVKLAMQLGDWAQVDVLRLDQGLPAGCMLLKGLLLGGLSAKMILSFTNSQFPPPLRYTGVVEGLPASLHGCSLSYLKDLLQTSGFRLQLLSGPYAAFVHEDLIVAGQGLSTDVDEFECYRSSRVWGFEPDLPIEVVRDWFFDVAASSMASQEILRRSFGNVSRLAGKLPKEKFPGFLLYL
ncbi:ABCG15 [Symbiodinium pilosum]|uniref:ABCG15 protein n=1 Tax=Symbiodinium pilosum TaxID=2952 RepID=A0A812QN67_SYMPI|nr:ABCG15 [Symbiodinium pilosum]